VPAAGGNVCRLRGGLEDEVPGSPLESVRVCQPGQVTVEGAQHLKPTTQSISLRLPKHLLDAIKAAANARDVPNQSLIKVWLQEKV
jgi:CopG antitoxin of type II toxin-antitoxin system